MNRAFRRARYMGRTYSLAASTPTPTPGADPATILTRYYFDAAVASLFTDAGSTNVSADNQTVQQWNDTSGSGRHMSQATAGQRPLYRVSGAVRWVESTDGVRFIGRDEASILNQPHTQVVAFRVVGSTHTDGTPIIGPGSSNAFFTIVTAGLPSELRLSSFDGGGGSPPVATGLSVDTDYIAVIRRENGSPGFIRIYSKTALVGTFNGTFNANNPDGVAAFSSNAGSSIGKARIYAFGAKQGAALTSGEEADVIAAFQAKLP
jgi:hypothetical protein